MNSDHDTIAAIATAPGEAGIAIVRISGPGSLAIADQIFRGKPPLPSERPGGSFIHGFIREESDEQLEGRDLDEVILLVYRAPHSYTREDVVEIQCHGGRTSARRILDVTLKAGARLAEPGEFTRRAFLNGRIDLVQAEAVADLIRAQSDRAAAAALEQLEGALSRSFGTLYDSLMAAASDLEATLDFVDGELPETTLREISDRVRCAREESERLLATWGEGHVLRDGAFAVICGRPNVGKSTLLNSLLGKSRAIVTEVPGTTRDSIEETVIIEGYPIRLVDTAGLRSTDCRVEKEGVARAQALMDKADILIYMIDGSRLLDPEGRGETGRLPSDRTIIVLNKSDLGQRVRTQDVAPHQAVVCSLLRNTGLDELRAALVSRLGVGGSPDAHGTISGRHRQIIQNALNSMNEACALLSSDKSEFIVLAANALRDALKELGKTTGQDYTEELLNGVFSKFCVGK